MKNLIIPALATLALLACTTDSKPETGTTPVKEGTPAVAQPDVEIPDVMVPQTYDAICGHVIVEADNKCGNWIMVDSTYVEIIHPSLGVMEWCGQGEKGAKVEAVGVMQDGRFVASSWKTVQ